MSAGTHAVGCAAIRQLLTLGGLVVTSSLAAGAGAQDAPKPQSIPAGVSTTPLPLKHTPKPTSGAITSQDLMTRLYIFADDSLGGRDVGTEGHFKATSYLAAEAKRMGLTPAGDSGTFFQTLPLKVKKIDRMSSFIAGGAALTLGTEWGFSAKGPLSFETTGLVFGGTLGDSTVQLTADQTSGKLVAFAMPASQTGIGLALEANNLLPSGAAGLVILVPQPVIGILGYVMQSGAFIDDGGTGATPRLFVMMEAATKLFTKPVASLAVGDAGAMVTVKAVMDINPSAFPARNVVALLPGSDPKLKQQYVAVGAHSDHVGVAPRGVDHDSVLVFNRIVRPGGAEDSDKFGTAAQFTEINSALAELRKTQPARRDSIFNGADDDGSGSVAVQEIAEYLSSLKVKPKRSTLFIWHAGEEKGLWGSAYFTEHPTVPRDSIVAQLNLDMVGRGAVTDQTGVSAQGKELRGGPDYLQLVGSRRLSTELGNLVESVNTGKKHNFTFDYAMDANGHPMNIYCRSDHYEYAKWGIPVTFFTTGGHSAYHQLTDEPQYIDYAHMQRVSRLVSDIALELGNRAARPTVDQPKLDPRGSCKQ